MSLQKTTSILRYSPMIGIRHSWSRVLLNMAFPATTFKRSARLGREAIRTKSGHFRTGISSNGPESTVLSTFRCRDETLTDLRTCLFFEQRCWRHAGWDPDEETMQYIRGIVEKIRYKIASESTEA